MESFCVFLRVPDDYAAMEKSSHLPEDAKGGQVFSITYHFFSDDTNQTAQQAQCNLSTFFEMLHEDFAFLGDSLLLADGAGTYNGSFSTKRCTEVTPDGAIRIVFVSHNESGHGSNRCDSQGANCAREIRNGAKALPEMIGATLAATLVREAQGQGRLQGHVPRLVRPEALPEGVVEDEEEFKDAPDYSFGSRTILAKSFPRDSPGTFVAYNFYSHAKEGVNGDLVRFSEEATPIFPGKVEVDESSVPPRVPSAEIAVRVMSNEEGREETKRLKARGEKERVVKLEKGKALRENVKEPKLTMSDSRIMLFERFYSQVSSNFTTSGAPPTESVPGITHAVSLPTDPVARRMYGEGWSDDGEGLFSRVPPGPVRIGRGRRVYGPKSEVVDDQRVWMKARAEKVRLKPKESEMLNTVNFYQVATDMAEELGFTNALDPMVIKEGFKKVWDELKGVGDESQMKWVRAKAGAISEERRTAEGLTPKDGVLLKGLDFKMITAEMGTESLPQKAVKTHFKKVWEEERTGQAAAAARERAEAAGREKEEKEEEMEEKEEGAEAVEGGIESGGKRRKLSETSGRGGRGRGRGRGGGGRGRGRGRGRGGGGGGRGGEGEGRGEGGRGKGGRGEGGRGEGGRGGRGGGRV